jgi:hypothetical protein
LDEWLGTISPSKLLHLDVSEESLDFDQSLQLITARIEASTLFKADGDGKL